jgi:hypothetical protein
VALKRTLELQGDWKPKRWKNGCSLYPSSISIGDCTLPFSVGCTCLHYQDPVKTVTSDTFDSVVINNQKAGPSALKDPQSSGIEATILTETIMTPRASKCRIV